MITFAADTRIRELLEADPDVLSGADRILNMLKTHTAASSFDKSAGELLIHVPVEFDAAACRFKTDITTEMKIKGIRKQDTPLMIYTDTETGEIVTQDPAAAKGQLSLL